MEQIFCIVHYNTPIITTCLISSILKLYPNGKIFLLDNSDKDKFDNTLFNNVIYLDNTKQKLINFDNYISQFHDTVKASKIINNFGSAKHAMSVEYLCSMLDKPFILMDSDVLLKNKIDCLFDEQFICISDVLNCVYPNGLKKPRILPFIALINPILMKQFNIHFFDPYRIDGLTKSGHYNDTGSSFYEDIMKYKSNLFKKIKYTDFIIHYGKGSYSNNEFQFKKWLFDNIKLWK